METAFGFGKQVDLDFDAAIDKVTADLQTEGFGVLSDIDVTAKMKEKLDALSADDVEALVHYYGSQQ